MKSTIKDIAKRAGVSPSTVSRVISGSSRISSDTQKKVRAIMEDMNYRPNLLARSLVNRTTNAVGVFSALSAEESMKHPFFAEALRGIGTTAAHHGLHLLLGTSASQEDDGRVVREMMFSGMIEGMILLSTLRDDPVAELLHRHSFPFVVIGHPCHGENYNRVDSDNEKAGRMVTEYLLKNGHRRICYLGADDSLSVTAKRQAGFEAALSDAGIPVTSDIFLKNPLSAGEDMLPALLHKSGGPTAVVAQDDALAIWLMGALQKAGRHVPEDVSIISFNNAAISAYTSPPLTTVEVHPYTLGEQAMALLYRLLKEPDTKPQWVEVPVKLMERGSVCPPAI